MMTNAVHPTPEDGAEANKITWDEFNKKLDAKGVTDDLLIRKLKQGLNAKITRVFFESGKTKVIKNEDGDFELSTNPAIFYSKPLVDYETRRKYTDMGLKLKDRYPSEKKEVTGRAGGPVEVTVIDKFELTNPGGTDSEDTT